MSTLQILRPDPFWLWVQAEHAFEVPQAVLDVPGVRYEQPAEGYSTHRCEVPWTAWDVPAFLSWFEDIYGSHVGSARPVYRGPGADAHLVGAFSLFEHLFPHQRDGVRFLLEHPQAVLGDEMGCGKSRVAAVAASILRQTLREAGQPARPVLIVGPKYLRSTWKHEIEAADVPGFCDFVALEGIQPDLAKLEGAQWIFSHYDVLHAWWSQILICKPAVAIVDEAHLAKNSRTRRGKAVALATSITPYRFLLTGTPVENRVGEFWNLLQLATGKWTWGSPRAFRERYCLPHDAPVWMADGSFKAISDVRVGDEVFGWSRSYADYVAPGYVRKGHPHSRLHASTVRACLRRRGRLTRVTFADGASVVCTADHEWLTSRFPDGKRKTYASAQLGAFVVRAVDTRTALLRPFLDTPDYTAGYIVGVLRGDGHVARREKFTCFPFEPSKARPAVSGHKVSLKVSDTSAAMLRRYVQYMGMRKAPLSTGVRAGFLYAEADNEETFDLVVRLDRNRNSDGWWAGFLGGIYDAEGSYRTISQHRAVNPETYQMVMDGLARFGFSFREGKTHRGITIRCSRGEFLRFWALASPALSWKLRDFLGSSAGKFMVDQQRVVRVDDMPGEHDVYTLTTDTGNYVAYGFASRNCGATMGTHGLVDGPAPTHTDELRTRLASCYLRRTKKDAGVELPPLTRQVVEIELTSAERVAHRELLQGMDASTVLQQIRQHKASKATIEWLGKLRKLTSKAKERATIEEIASALEQGEHVLCFTWQKKTAEAIANRVWARWIDGDTPTRNWQITAVHGDHSAAERERVVANFQKSGGLLVATGDSLGVGVTLHKASLVVMHDLDWVPSRMLQWEARAHRIGLDHPVLSKWMVAKGTLDELLVKALLKKAPRIAETVGDEEPGTLADLLGEAIDEERASWDGLLGWAKGG